ncbi:MAG TPA: hypothetical protein VM493_07760 [Vicinamibacterales bacterium]|jgi:hypothetical protein|nr:hypothetical protein [Vicinamibacterales bacterium]
MAVIQVIPEGDLALENGNFVWIEGSSLVRQNIASRFSFYAGEWFLDLREGVPYYRDILVKSPDRLVVRSIFEQVLRSTPGVTEILSFDLTLDAEERTIRFAFEVQSTDGIITVNPDDDAFVVRL